MGQDVARLAMTARVPGSGGLSLDQMLTISGTTRRRTEFLMFQTPSLGLRSFPVRAERP
jgi:hypothetical protein